MNIAIKAKYVDLTDPLKKYVEGKIQALGKYIDVMEAKVELERDRHHQSGDVFRAEVMLTIGGKSIYADASTGDMYAAIDLVIPKLKEQVTKFKDKRQTQERRGARAAKKRN